jgi:sensor histidine kinase YesM
MTIEIFNTDHELINKNTGVGFINGVIIILCLSTLFISTLIKLLIDINQERSERMDATIKKQELELKLVKNQYSPHFLLNALNNMYSISVLNPEGIGEHINRLSSLMNYVTYSLNKKKIPLVKEIDFIKDYVYFQLEKDESSYKVEQHYSLSNEHAEIVPNVLFPFVENAFKHSYDPSKPGKVEIRITELNNILLMNISNTYSGNKIEKDDFGVGLKNVKLILDNEFKKRHDLVTKKDGDTFSIELNISI